AQPATGRRELLAAAEGARQSALRGTEAAATTTEATARRYRGRARPRRQLVARRIEAAAATADEHVIEQRGDLLGVAVAHAIDAHAGGGGIGHIEPRDPGRRRAQHLGFARDDEDRVLPRDRLELDQVLAQAAFAGIQDLLELGDDRLGRRV